MDKERQAVIVGCGRFTQSRLTPLESCVTPVGMFKTAAKRAAMDATPGSTDILRDSVAIATPGMFLEQRFFLHTKRKQYRNFSDPLQTPWVPTHYPRTLLGHILAETVHSF